MSPVVVPAHHVPAFEVKISHDTTMWNEGFEYAGTWLTCYVDDQANVDFVKRLVDAWNVRVNDYGRSFSVDVSPHPVMVDPKLLTAAADLRTTIPARLKRWDGI